MAKRKQKYEGKPQLSPVSSSSPSSPTYLLDVLAEKRTGGAESIKGFVFQCRYAAWKILNCLAVQGQSEAVSVRLEGIEDLDVGKVLAKDRASAEFIQVKYSINRMDAGAFWEKGILQNFAEAYLADPQVVFG